MIDDDNDADNYEDDDNHHHHDEDDDKMVPDGIHRTGIIIMRPTSSLFRMQVNIS